jgi:hypothetical protein
MKIKWFQNLLNSMSDLIKIGLFSKYIKFYTLVDEFLSSAGLATFFFKDEFLFNHMK